MKISKKEWWVYTKSGVLVGHGYEYGGRLYDSRVKELVFVRHGYSDDKYKIVIK